MQIELPVRWHKVVFHRYRSTRAWPILATFYYERHDKVDEFRSMLAASAGKGMDNHTVYEVWLTEGSEPICFWFSDWKMYIALKCDNQPW